jgi:hypothetical protein
MLVGIASSSISRIPFVSGRGTSRISQCINSLPFVQRIAWPWLLYHLGYYICLLMMGPIYLQGCVGAGESSFLLLCDL